jgi:hypothetical protein
VKKGQNEPNVNELAARWLRAKAREEAANRERVAIEEQMLPHLDTLPEGQRATILEDFKVLVVKRLSRSISESGVQAVQQLIPENYWPLKQKWEVDVNGLKWLQLNFPQYYEIAARYVTTKPGKPGFKVERLEKVEVA